MIAPFLLPRREPTAGERMEADAPELAVRTLALLRKALGDEEAEQLWNLPGTTENVRAVALRAAEVAEELAQEELVHAGELRGEIRRRGGAA